jgi:hypothetical protein
LIVRRSKFTSEAYNKFIQSAFWKQLSALKKKMVPKCEDCGSESQLQCHHISYPADWADTVLADLRVLCGACHIWTEVKLKAIPTDGEVALLGKKKALALAICRELSNLNKGEPFFISMNKLGSMIEARDKWQPSNTLAALIRDGFLRIETKGNASGKATRYRYVKCS